MRIASAFSWSGRPDRALHCSKCTGCIWNASCIHRHPDVRCPDFNTVIHPKQLCIKLASRPFCVVYGYFSDFSCAGRSDTENRHLWSAHVSKSGSASCRVGFGSEHSSWLRRKFAQAAVYRLLLGDADRIADWHPSIPKVAAKRIVERVKERSALPFHWFRNILKQPTWYCEVMNEVKAQDDSIVLLDAPAFFELLRIYLKEHGSVIE